MGLLIVTEIFAQDPDTWRELDVYQGKANYATSVPWCECSPTTGPTREDWPIYGPGKSLIGIVRGWAPSTFYPLAPTFRKWQNKGDMELLEDPARLSWYLHRRQFHRIIYTDTVFLPYRDQAKKN